ncbi:MAG: sulfotransferase [Pseudotabrizicola sp.]|uniref:sulfotransferase n=1 Tax=Pseudotabrizicola sp. TaxID=2939647 RepID=UPI00271E30EA|nr:sulfotransferase [Pseudotabrizicola sp.]MDO9638020.1 sulfotransferase [Pseudotabrizicola sp.]
MTLTPSARSVAADLEAALDLLADYRGRDDGDAGAEPLPSLLAQCVAMRDGFPEPQPMRSIHHFACTGGTLLSRCVAALPNTVLLSEIDPLSRAKLEPTYPKTEFAPHDILLHLLRADHRVDQAVVVEAFQAAITTTLTALARRGQRLVLRDHPHSQFCTGVDAASRQTVHEMLVQCCRVKALVTVRHPLDSFASLDALGWRQFSPFTLEAYGQRYLAFLTRHASLPVLRYEDFVAEPQAGLERICGHLDLPYEPLSIDLIGAVAISGDSGRSGSNITPRPRRAVPPAIEAQRGDPAYLRLCAQLGYDP